MSGASNGVTPCLILKNERYFTDLVLVSNRPDSYLSMHIAPSTCHGQKKTVFGNFSPPATYVLEVPDVFGCSAY